MKYLRYSSKCLFYIEHNQTQLQNRSYWFKYVNSFEKISFKHTIFLDLFLGLSYKYIAISIYFEIRSNLGIFSSAMRRNMYLMKYTPSSRFLCEYNRLWNKSRHCSVANRDTSLWLTERREGGGDRQVTAPLKAESGARGLGNGAHGTKERLITPRRR